MKKRDNSSEESQLIHSQIDSDVCKRLLEVRNIIGCSKEDIAKKIGISRPTYSDIENGVRKLSRKNLEKTTRNLSISENWLLTGTGDMFVSVKNNFTFTDIEKTKNRFGN